MSSMNKVIAGDYEGWSVRSHAGSIHLVYKRDDRELTPETVAEWRELEPVTWNEQNMFSSKSLLGSLFLGPLDFLFGISSKTVKLYQLAFKCDDGMKGIMTVDIDVYHTFLKRFQNEG
ncbi:hypothetical protein [Salisediminibacterium selenitireducens]|uniref:Uncharacterized protein n=1 Tax=Bacillus selenitireducens (strain ATCC 700615 / DSM 15326 / MLS10) TaxID=439292 RepID=D6XWG4_BACIE|nr:hypothetical protein [Salisediminibacterium selenitireducens]ADH97806.1 hypothetical protein Bsel_0264 [[Bacillus] selenitireducens MLS10]